MQTRLPATAFIGASLFFTGVTYASTLPYVAIVAVDALGIPNQVYALLLTVGALVAAGTSVTLGYISDKIGDRRLLVIGCALTGALAHGTIFVARSPLAFIIAYCAIMPVGNALFSQTFSYARSYYNLRRPERAEAMVSILRTVFAVAWVLLPPVAGAVAASSGVFNVYAISTGAYLVCALIFAVLTTDPSAKIGNRSQSANAAVTPPASSIELPVAVGIGGVMFIQTAIALHVTTTPLAIVRSLNGAVDDVGRYASLAALLEIPFMLLWGLAVRRFPKFAIIAFNAALYAIYLLLLSRTTTVTGLLWLQGLNAIATAALLSVTIAYMQEAIRGRIGLSTSLLDVAHVVSVVSAAGIFALVTSGGDYPRVFVVGAGLAATGATILALAHTLLAPRGQVKPG